MLLSRLLLFILSVAIVGVFSSDKKCRILALQGGGDKGAYQAGAIHGLVNLLTAEEASWDVISGISVGSFNAAMIAVHEQGKEKQAGDLLLEEWRKITGGNYLFQQWPWGGVIRGLFFETGLFDTTPMLETITNFLNSSGLKRTLVLGTVDAETGDYFVYDNKSLSDNEKVRDGVMSSGAYPVIFPFYKFNNMYNMDGGVKRGIDIGSAIHRCEDRGFHEKDIVIDVVLCSIKTLDNVDPTTLRPLSVLGRYLEIQAFDNSMRDLEDVLFYFKDVTLRYLVAPTQKLPSNAIPLNFSPHEIETMIKIGQDDAKDVVNKGSGVYFKEFIEKHSIRKQNENFYKRKKTQSPN